LGGELIELATRNLFFPACFSILVFGPSVKAFWRGQNNIPFGPLQLVVSVCARRLSFCSLQANLFRSLLSCAPRKGFHFAKRLAKFELISVAKKLAKPDGKHLAKQSV